MDRPYLTIPQAATQAKVPQKVIKAAIEAGTLPVVQLRTMVRIIPRDLQRWLHPIMPRPQEIPVPTSKKDHKQKRYRYDAGYRAYVQAESTRDYQRIRLLVIEAYGDGWIGCRGCGTTDIRVLCLDHIADNGKEDRKQRGNGQRFYRSLLRDGFPPGLQLLCFNCNFLKAQGYPLPGIRVEAMPTSSEEETGEAGQVTVYSVRMGQVRVRTDRVV